MDLRTKIKKYKQLKNIEKELIVWDYNNERIPPLMDALAKKEYIQNNKECTIPLNHERYNRWFVIDSDGVIEVPRNINKTILKYLRIDY